MWFLVLFLFLFFVLFLQSFKSEETILSLQAVKHRQQPGFGLGAVVCWHLLLWATLSQEGSQVPPFLEARVELQLYQGKSEVLPLWDTPFHMAKNNWTKGPIKNGQGFVIPQLVQNTFCCLKQFSLTHNGATISS